MIIYIILKIKRKLLQWMNKWVNKKKKKVNQSNNDSNLSNMEAILKANRSAMRKLAGKWNHSTRQNEQILSNLSFLKMGNLGIKVASALAPFELLFAAVLEDTHHRLSLWSVPWRSANSREVFRIGGVELSAEMGQGRARGCWGDKWLIFRRLKSLWRL